MMGVKPDEDLALSNDFNISKLAYSFRFYNYISGLFFRLISIKLSFFFLQKDFDYLIENEFDFFFKALS